MNFLKTTVMSLCLLMPIFSIYATFLVPLEEFTKTLEDKSVVIVFKGYKYREETIPFTYITKRGGFTFELHSECEINFNNLVIEVNMKNIQNWAHYLS